MLSIDEIIANEIKKARELREQYECMAECSDIFQEKKKVFIEQCKHDAEYHEQLLEFLEELKTLRKEKSEFQTFAKDNDDWEEWKREEERRENKEETKGKLTSMGEIQKKINYPIDIED